MMNTTTTKNPAYVARLARYFDANGVELTRPPTWKIAMYYPGWDGAAATAPWSPAEGIPGDTVPVPQPGERFDTEVLRKFFNNIYVYYLEAEYTAARRSRTNLSRVNEFVYLPLTSPEVEGLPLGMKERIIPMFPGYALFMYKDARFLKAGAPTMYVLLKDGEGSWNPVAAPERGSFVPVPQG